MKRSTHTHTSIRLLVAIHGGRITANINTGDFLSERGHPLLPPSPERTAGEEFLLSPDFSSLLASFPFIGPHTVPKRLHASLDFRSRNMSRRLATVSTTSQPASVFGECATFGKSLIGKTVGWKREGEGREWCSRLLETARNSSKHHRPPPRGKFRVFENSRTRLLSSYMFPRIIHSSRSLKGEPVPAVSQSSWDCFILRCTIVLAFSSELGLSLGDDLNDRKVRGGIRINLSSFWNLYGDHSPYNFASRVSLSSW